MSLPQIIGLGGVARSGKDTIGMILHEVYGYRIASFSDILNKALYTLDRSMGDSGGLFIRTDEASYPVHYANLIDSLGYESAKEYPGVRKALQAMGTEVGRTLLGEDVWVDAMFNDLPSGLVAIVNVRFPNEFDAVRKRGGVVWRVTRPGYTAANGHISDTALDGHIFDHHIENDGTVGDLAQKVVEAVTWHQMDALSDAHNNGVRAGS